MNKWYYEVAGHQFCISSELELDAVLDNYEPFRISAPVHNVIFALDVISNKTPYDYVEETVQDDEGQQIKCGHTDDGKAVFEFILGGSSVATLLSSADASSATLSLKQDNQSFALNNAIMVLYALSTSGKNTALFHAAAVSLDGYAYIFLGKSGTGKSTHARLWLKHIKGTELMNDDNPVVRIENGKATLYGSPWSGKTPCYKNIKAPLAGIVQLSQAPHNRIVRLNGIESYAILVPSISGKRWDKGFAEGLHSTENALAQTVKCWHLECLPDEAAAKICNENIRVR